MTSTIEYKIVNFADVHNDLLDMFLDHAAEVGTLNECRNKNFSLNISDYVELENQGKHVSIIAVDGDKTIGYCSLIIDKSLHEYSKLVATTTAFYLIPSYRKGRTGIDFIKAVEKIVSDREDVHYLQIVENYNYMLHPLLSRLGYRITDIVHTKTIRME